MPSGYQARRAVWLEIDWVMNPHSDAEIAALVEHLQTQRINDVFAYLTYLKSGDVFNPTFDYAETFTQHFRDHSSDMRLLAWIGVPVTMTAPDGRLISDRLADPQTRAVIVETAVRVVTEMGFDGVHLNAEVIENNSATFLLLLREMRAALPDEAVLSTTSHALQLDRNILFTPYPTLAHHTSPDYLRQIAQEVDQIALMAYDSGLFFPRDYRSWVAYQVETAADAVAGTDVELLIGLPTSEEATLSHHVWVENVGNALYGFRVGLANSADASLITGIAVYPAWETDDQEWEQISLHLP